MRWAGRKRFGQAYKTREKLLVTWSSCFELAEMKSVLPLAACLLFVSSNGQGHGNPRQGPGSSHPLAAARTSPPEAGPVGCARRTGQGCVKSLVSTMECVHGTYVDTCNECQCATKPNENYPLSPSPTAASAGPVGCGRRKGQGCAKSIVSGMVCAHGTYVDTCNECQSAKKPNYPLSPSPPAASAGPVGCGRRKGQGCAKSIVSGMVCAHGTYVDTCNECQSAKKPNADFSLSRTGQILGYLLQGPGSSQPLMAASPLPPAASEGPVGCGGTIGQGCEQSIVGGMNCAYGTYMDMCNRCHCAKGPNEICGGAWGEHGLCTANLFCFVENVILLVGRCRLYIYG
ncbi:uncharacterized protein [Penaeus vannamei]|uniref:uncharacterized protein n=1 Tax=Penaeus vannamei TaxID=6689 RepID=UPI00387F5088